MAGSSIGRTPDFGSGGRRFDPCPASRRHPGQSDADPGRPGDQQPQATNKATPGQVASGVSVPDVVRCHGVARQTLHGWLRRCARDGLGGPAAHSSPPLSCPHQTPPEVEARIGERCAGLAPPFSLVTVCDAHLRIIACASLVLTCSAVHINDGAGTGWSCRHLSGGVPSGCMRPPRHLLNVFV